MNKSPVRFILGVLTLAAFTALASTAFGAFTPAEGAALQAALAGKALVEGALVPHGFAKVARTKGDLDGDGTDDVALIVRRVGKKRHAKGALDDDEDVPQAVLIFTGNKSGKYTLWKVGISHFMGSSPNLMEEGGVDTFQIKKGVLTIASDISMSMGGWSAGGCATKWRNEPGGLRLIGLTITDIDRKCACGTTKDTNYLTGLTIYRDDQEQASDDPPKQKVKRTTAKPQTILWETFDFEKMCSSGS